MKNKVIFSLSFLAGIVLLNSCLKDDIGEYWKDDLAGKMYATIAVPTLQQMALKPVAGEVPFTFMVNIATDALPSEDITVNLIIDPAAVTQYNTDFKKAYKSFPTVALTSATLVIKAGTRNGYANGKVWGAETLNACDNFIAAISIASAKTASGKDVPVGGNMKSYLLALPISNPYAADYRAVGYRIHPTAGTFTVDKTETASTVNCKTIRKTQMGDYPYILDIEILDATMVVGGKTMNKVSLSTPDVAPENFGMYSTYTGDPATPPTAPGPDTNYYDPSTKRFVLNYYYLSAGAPRKIYEILTRL